MKRCAEQAECGEPDGPQSVIETTTGRLSRTESAPRRLICLSSAGMIAMGVRRTRAARRRAIIQPHIDNHIHQLSAGRQAVTQNEAVANDAMKGEQIGAGATCEVFRWGTDRVLKLFRPQYDYAVETEAERSRAAHACGVPSPEVFGIVEVEGRRGILFSRVDGPTLMSHVGEIGIETVARILAQLHASLHEIPVVGLPTLRSQVESAEGLDEQARTASLARIDLMPAGEVLCHGDFHPGNVVISPDGAVVLDWVNASAAPAAADVARTLMLIGYQGLSDQTTQNIRTARREMTDAYLASYLEFTSVTREEVARCEPAMAAALLHAEPENLEREALRALIES